MKHLPFHSIYRQGFEVVEQRQGNTTLYPHTDQLPVLLRALNLDFTTPLPGRIARVDHRADGFHKIIRWLGTGVFCTYVNASRPDQVRLFPLLNPDLVTKVSVVQQITGHSDLGRCHHFRFYAGDDFFPEIYLSGKRLVFAEHVLQRFSTRVPNHVGGDLSNLLTAFFGQPIISLPVDWGRALILSYDNSLLAFPYRESATEFFLTTCLTVNEIDSLGRGVQAFNLHYGPHFTPPAFRHWSPGDHMEELLKSWRRKTQPRAPLEPVEKGDWSRMAQFLYDSEDKKDGHRPGSRLLFLDHVPGPCPVELYPDDPEPRFDELALVAPPRETPATEAGRPPASRPPIL